MKNYLLTALCAWGLLSSFTTTDSFNLKGTVDIPGCKKVYFYQVQNEHYKSAELIDSIPVVKGAFTYNNAALKTNLYCFATQNLQNEYTEDLALALLEPTASTVKLYREQGKLKVNVKGSALAEKYVQFNAGKYIVSNQQLLDSLDNLFFAARKVENREEMARVKELSIPYYAKSSAAQKSYTEKTMQENKGNLFGLFLYYSNYFQSSQFDTMKEIKTTRERIANYDAVAKNTIFYKNILSKLDRFEKCAIGHVAPDITGIDSLGKVVTLKEFRGKYVLVDFWSSGCGWCRKETPNLLKAYNDNKENNFTILGVSSDYRKQDWLNAMHEDKSYWNQMLLKKEDVKPLYADYCIIGIPHIFLVDPQGVIVAKDLRGEDIINTVATFVSKQKK